MSEIQPNSRREARQQRIQKIIRYGGFAGTGIGSAAIFGFLSQGQIEAAAISALLTVVVTGFAIAYKFLSGVTNRVLDKIEEELDNLEEPIAQWIVNQPKRVFTWAWWWKINSQFQNKYYESLIDTFRELKIEGFRIGLPVLDLENVFVSLQVAPEIPEKATGSMIHQQIKTGNQEIWDFLKQSTKKEFQAFRRLAVIGPPGSGKTTLLKHLTLIYAKKQSKVYNAPKLIPILLYLRDIRHLILAEPLPNLPFSINYSKNFPGSSFNLSKGQKLTLRLMNLSPQKSNNVPFDSMVYLQPKMNITIYHFTL
ncbi:ABC-type cobalt transport system, ATPase component [Xenococcus sp. PCC 7305]|nr:ABC-type cobalt transport system, ATPase component [Xenococcus sp. PCC 7305]